jgi:hypothetical protein
LTSFDSNTLLPPRLNPYNLGNINSRGKGSNQSSYNISLLVTTLVEGTHMPHWVEKLTDIISKEKLSNKLIAETLGTSSQYCSKLLAGDSPPPSAGKILKLVNFLEKEGFLSENEALDFLNEIIKEKLGTSELILLNEYDTRIKRLLIQNDDFLSSFYRIYTNNLIIHHETIKIIQSLQHLPTDHHYLVVRFIDFLINSDLDKSEILLEFLEK